MHGGRSSDGIGCGAFFIVATVVASGAGWDPGAALSFMLYTHYTFHGGFSSLGSGSGSFCTHSASLSSSAAWYYGAALK